MKKRYVFLTTLFVIFLLLGIYVLIDSQDRIYYNISSSKTGIEAASHRNYVLHFQHQGIILNQDDDYAVAAYYPITKNADVNQKIETFVLNEVNDFVRNEFSTTGAFSEENRYYFNISYNIEDYSDDLKSYILTINSYTGGAHGNNEIKTFTYNLENGESYTLEDVIDIKKIPELTETIKEEIKKQLGSTYDENWVNEGIKDLSNFSLNSHYITFYFSPYQVSSYANGLITVTLELKDFANNDL